MAGFATHDIFGQEVLEKFPDQMLKSIIEKHSGVFGIGCQGPDLFLYNLLMQAGSYEKNVGLRMHKEGSSRFFAYLLWNIWDTHDYEWMETGFSYLYGALAHYTLDSMLHPYVYAKSGFDPAFPCAKQTSRIHHRLESAIDAKVIAVKQDILPSKYQPLNSIAICREERELLSGLLAETIKKSHRIGMRKENVSASLRMMRKIVCGFYGCTDKQKKRLERFEGTFFEDYLCSNFMVADEYIRKRRIMNTENEQWCNPWRTDEKSVDSVWEIYDKAVLQYQEYVKILQKLMPLYLRKWVSLRHPYYAYQEENTIFAGEAMEEMSPKQLRQKICDAARKLGNLSYYSGLPIRENIWK